MPGCKKMWKMVKGYMNQASWHFIQEYVCFIWNQSQKTLLILKLHFGNCSHQQFTVAFYFNHLLYAINYNAKL